MRNAVRAALTGTLAAFVLLGSPAHAEQRVIGLGFGASELSFSDPNLGPELEQESETLLLRLGSEMSYFRLLAEALGSRFDPPSARGVGQGNLVLLNLQGDALVPLAGKRIQLFAGGHVGTLYTRLREYEHRDYRLETSKDQWSLAYGFQGGVLVRPGRHLQIEGGLKTVRLPGHSHEFQEERLLGDDRSWDFSVDDMRILYLSVNVLY